MRRAPLILALLLCGMSAGCPAKRDPAALPPRLEAGKGIMLPTSGPGSGDRTVVLLIQMRLATIEVPAGTASGSEEIWSYLDEEPLGTLHAASLGRNGLRLGLGRTQSWPDVARILKRMTGQAVQLRDSLAEPGNPVQLVLKANQPAQTIFTFYDDRTLTGVDVPAGDNVLTVTCTVDEQDLAKVLLTAVPQVRYSRRKLKVSSEGGHVSMAVEPVLHPFTALTFQVPVRPGEFVVVGPGAAARLGVSAGHHFLVKEKEGVDFETVLVLMPRAVEVPAR